MADELAFDPLAPITFEPNEDDGYYVEYIPPIEEPEAQGEPPAEKPLEPVTARFEKTVKGLPGLKKLVYHVVDWCREERCDQEVLDEIARFQGGAVSVYRPETLLALLVDCGALVRTNPPAADAETQGQAQEEPAAEDVAGELESAGDAEEGTVFSVELEGEYLEVEEAVAARYVAHEEALAVVEADDPLAVFAQVVDTKPQYVPLFERVLVACAQEAGATKKMLDALIDNDPVCKSPRVFSGYFVDKLEAAGAIEFGDAWRTTAAGEALLAEGGLLNRG